MKVDYPVQSDLPASLDLPGQLERGVNGDRAGHLEKLDHEDQLDLPVLEVGTTHRPRLLKTENYTHKNSPSKCIQCSNVFKCLHFR